MNALSPPRFSLGGRRQVRFRAPGCRFSSSVPSASVTARRQTYSHIFGPGSMYTRRSPAKTRPGADAARLRLIRVADFLANVKRNIDAETRDVQRLPRALLVPDDAL